jgi:hypothetical protein
VKREEKSETKKISLSVHIAGKKKPVTKEVLVCSKSGEIIKFLEKGSWGNIPER